MRRALVVTSDHLLSFEADGSQTGGLKRCIPIADIEAVGMSRFRDSYLVVTVKDSYAFVCVAETKVALVRALAARYRALTTGGTLPVTVGDKLTYRAYKGDGPDKERTIHFQQVPDPAVFGARVQEPWEAKLAALPGGVGGGPIDEGAPADPSAAAAGSVVKAAYAKMERQRPFHVLQADKLSLVVSVPVPPKLKLADLLSPAESTKLRAKGFVR